MVITKIDSFYLKIFICSRSGPFWFGFIGSKALKKFLQKAASIFTKFCPFSFLTIT